MKYKIIKKYKKKKKKKKVYTYSLHIFIRRFHKIY